ncbi:SET and MYND domain-containing protein 4-like [Contarinia nasturtii]|uniref:SET and MYND domain-containing protein 4-like n=1 Tax=Contarinia nasturtii TaxID=265458 RepID=UPI0012D484D4|nr:SET and MYND domain-containing protein 4-like [Contarinia nasturtii]XP_031629234.1 SET and MYND domain-containing protein 4-like [Contarinia nasturtii]
MFCCQSNPNRDQKPKNILWQKDKLTNFTTYIDIFNIKGHKISLESLNRLFIGEFSLLKRKGHLKVWTEAGNKLFVKEMWLDAMRAYNMALPDSIQMEEIYSLRAPCFYHLKMPEQCLIDLAMIKKCSNGSLPKELQNIELEARQQISDYNSSNEGNKSILFSICEPALDFDEHEKYNGVANCLEINYNEIFGRHIITTQDLKIGQTIIVEEPYTIVTSFQPDGSGSTIRCLSCFQACKNFIACPHCSYGVFCNEDCIKSSLHKFECNMPVILFMEGMTKFNLILRLIVRINDDFPDVNVLIETVNLLRNGKEVTGLTSDRQKNFCLLFQLVHHHEKLSYHQIEELRKGAACVFLTVMRFPEFTNKFNNNFRRQFLQHFIFHLCHFAPHAFRLFENCLIGTEHEHSLKAFEEKSLYAFAMYPFSSFINHSCIPNVAWFSVGNRLVCKVLRPIRKGEQIFRTYFSSAYTQSSVSSSLIADFLKYQYQFECKCSICLKECEIHSNRETNLENNSLYNDAFACELLSVNAYKNLPLEKIESYIAKGIEFLEEYDPFHPITKTMTIQRTLMNLWMLSTSRMTFFHRSFYMAVQVRK